MVHNKKSEHSLLVASKLDNTDLLDTDNQYDYFVKLEDKLQYETTQGNEGDEELEMCLEEIEKNLAKLR